MPVAIVISIQHVGRTEHKWPQERSNPCKNGRALHSATTAYAGIDRPHKLPKVDGMTSSRDVNALRKPSFADCPSPNADTQVPRRWNPIWK